MKYRLIIFDLGNVIVKFDHGISARKIVRFSNRFHLDVRKVHNLFFDSPITYLHDEGRLSPREFYHRVKDALCITIKFKDFKAYWNDIFFLNQGMSRLIKRLKKRYMLYLMSNTNKMHFDFIKKKFSIIKEFDRTILSFRVGTLKPNPKIYNHALRLAGVRPEETIYIDDRRELVEGARRLGITALTFTGLRQLKKDLRGLGVDFS